MDDSVGWTDYLALFDKNGVEVHQGRKKSLMFDEDIECMVKIQK